MNTQSDKTPENKSLTPAKETTQNPTGGEGKAQFADNRPETAQLQQLQGMANDFVSQTPLPVQKKKNDTGLPDNLKSGIENLSGISMDDVKVHRNSNKPAQLNAHAYAQGTDIHLASGQEKHLPHEAWHVVQQKQGRVKPTLQMKGNVNVNDDPGLEKEADMMGEKAANYERTNDPSIIQGKLASSRNQFAPVKSKTNTNNSREAQAVQLSSEVIQRKLVDDLASGTLNVAIVGENHGEINTKEERQNWGTKDIELYYEANDIKLDDQEVITPDDNMLRLEFCWTGLRYRLYKADLKEITNKELDTLEDELLLMINGALSALNDEAVAKKIDWQKTGFTKKIIEGFEELKSILDMDMSYDDLVYDGLPDMKAKIEKFQKNVWNKLTGIGSQKHDKPTLMNKSKARSREMLKRINENAGKLSKTIYKIGRAHTSDMIDNGWELQNKVGVFDIITYTAEYKELFEQEKIEDVKQEDAKDEAN